MRKSKTSRINHRGIFAVTVIAILIFLLGFFLGKNNMNEVEARDYRQSQKYYTSIEIEKGDTLWSIAEEYMTEEYESRNDYIDEVRQMNHITGSEIQYGRTILVPYYK